MNGFYYIRDKQTGAPSAELGMQVSRFPDVPELPIDMQPGLRIFADEKSFLVQRSDCTLFTIGCLVCNGKWGKAVLDWLADELVKDAHLPALLEQSNAHGQFCLVVRKGQNVFVVTDPLASFPIFYYEDDHTLQISNLMFPIARHNPVHLDMQSLAEYMSFSYCFKKTCFEEIHLLDRGMVYCPSQNMKGVRYQDFIKDLHYGRVKSVEQAANEIVESMQSSMVFLNDKSAVFADITGGFDTRTNATILHSMGIPFDGGICGEQVLGEQSLATQVAEALSVEFHSNILLRNREDFQKTIELHKCITGGVPLPYHSTELLHYYQFINRSFDVHVTGFAGSQLLDIFSPKLTLFSKRINPASFIRKKLSYYDIYRPGVYNEAVYNRRLVAKLEGLSEEFITDHYDQYAAFLDLSTFNRFYHGTLIATHNVILPSYCPFLESGLIRISLETPLHLKKHRAIQRVILTKMGGSLNRIMTSHGFVNKVNPIRQLRHEVNDFTRMVLYSFPALSGAVQLLRKYRDKHRVQMAVIQRAFWTDFVDEIWDPDWPIFQIVDRKFVEEFARINKTGYQLKAKIAYINELMDRCHVVYR